MRDSQRVVSEGLRAHIFGVKIFLTRYRYYDTYNPDHWGGRVWISSTKLSTSCLLMLKKQLFSSLGLLLCSQCQLSQVFSLLSNRPFLISSAHHGGKDLELTSSLCLSPETKRRVLENPKFEAFLNSKNMCSITSLRIVLRQAQDKFLNLSNRSSRI